MSYSFRSFILKVAVLGVSMVTIPDNALADNFAINEAISDQTSIGVGVGNRSSNMMRQGSIQQQYGIRNRGINQVGSFNQGQQTSISDGDHNNSSNGLNQFSNQQQGSGFGVGNNIGESYLNSTQTGGAIGSSNRTRNNGTQFNRQRQGTFFRR